MHGNVSEWCRDWHKDYNHNGEALTDPVGPEKGQKRIARGGDTVENPLCCRSAKRRPFVPTDQMGYVGFRVALVPVQ